MIKRALSLIFIAATATAAGAAEGGKTATSTLMDATGKPVGSATFTEQAGGVELKVTVSGLPPGKHGFHLHENGKCDPPGFATAGGHFNPFTKQHGAQNPKGKHAGDLPNLDVKPDGTAKLTADVKGVTLGDGAGSLLKQGGTSLLIHADPDDEKSDPAGKSGARIACGVVVGK